MTVSYQYEVASSTSGGFTRLLFKWKGSLYKLIYRELLLFLGAFAMLSAMYRHVFTTDQKRLFEKLVVYCDTFISLIPLSFVLGFYVAYVAGRWWQQYMALPWPDKIMHSIALYVTGNDDHGRMIRRTLMRYLNLSLILVLRSISSAVKRRFPTLDHLVEAGFMTKVELDMFQSVPSVEFNTYWIPCTWFISLLKKTKKENRITDSQGLKIIMEEFNEYRSKCGLLWSYDWVSIPLVYTQVVTIATYSFFLAALVGRQFVEEMRKPYQMEVDIYIPVFTILQFFFYMGLLKVAEQLINPFGDDDEDFELNWLIDRHTKVSYLGVDILMTRSPPLVKDMYFDDVDLTLPYTEAAVSYKKRTYRGSVHDMFVPEEKQSMFLPEILEEDDDNQFKPLSTPKASMLNLFAGNNQNSVNLTVPDEMMGRERSYSPRNLRSPGVEQLNPGFPSSSAGIRRPSLSKISASSPQVGLAGLDDCDDTSSVTLEETLNRGRRPSSFSMLYRTSMDRESMPSSEPAELYSSFRSGLNFQYEDSPDAERRSGLPPQSPRPRLKSCPKLVFVKRKTSRGKKTGVRWTALEKRNSDPPLPFTMTDNSTMLEQFLLPRPDGTVVDSVPNLSECRFYDLYQEAYGSTYPKKNVSFHQDTNNSDRSSFESCESSPNAAQKTHQKPKVDQRTLPILGRLFRKPHPLLLRDSASSGPVGSSSMPNIVLTPSEDASSGASFSGTSSNWPTDTPETAVSFSTEAPPFRPQRDTVPTASQCRVHRQFSLSDQRQRSVDSLASDTADTGEQQSDKHRNNGDKNKHHSRWKDMC